MYCVFFRCTSATFFYSRLVGELYKPLYYWEEDTKAEMVKMLLSKRVLSKRTEINLLSPFWFHLPDRVLCPHRCSLCWCLFTLHNITSCPAVITRCLWSSTSSGCMAPSSSSFSLTSGTRPTWKARGYPRVQNSRLRKARPMLFCPTEPRRLLMEPRLWLMAMVYITKTACPTGKSTTRTEVLTAVRWRKPKGWKKNIQNVWPWVPA